MSKHFFRFISLGLLLGLNSCAEFSTSTETSYSDFDKETANNDAQVREDKARADIRRLEAALADYTKGEDKIPNDLNRLIPKYIGAIPTLDIPVCGPESNRVVIYPRSVVRGGQVDGTKIRGSGHWGYVFTDDRVIIFVDCLKPSLKGIPWYKVRGVY